MKTIPTHLKKYIVEQNYSKYTPEDHASWRYILRQLRDFLTKNAHDCYLEGLEKTGISIDRIPSIKEVSEKLEKFGWTAVPVSGFIPPAAFMELQSYSILPIASDMRSVEHLHYTPAPDIVHEAAGHAPILVNLEFAQYLKKYASIAKNAIISKEDLDVYEAIRILSDIKEDPESSIEAIKKAEMSLRDVMAKVSHVSEAALLGRMNWWTAEYGLIGELNDPKIFGAGLLSSVGESRHCLGEKVKKIPLSVDCVNYSYDITEPQPQLFVAKDFQQLVQVLEELANRMAFRRGGIYGAKTAQKSLTVNTVQLNSRIQIGGILSEFLKDTEGVQNDQPIYLKFSGPCQLAIGGKVLPGQGILNHPEGFGTPVGFLKGFSKCLSTLSETELQNIGLIQNKICHLEFATGVKVSGELIAKTFSEGQLILLTFNQAKVSYKDQILFLPEWGVFDMAVGSAITSVFAGPPDYEAFGENESFVAKRVFPRKITNQRQRLFEIYSDIRKVREEKQDKKQDKTKVYDFIVKTFEELSLDFTEDWLPLLELFEISLSLQNASLTSKIEKNLRHQIFKSAELKIPIEEGLRLAIQELEHGL
jgi:phenylalanine-4-hydroxylase